MATTSEIQVTEAYIGLLGRAPDPAGLAYWVGQYDNAVAAGQDATFALKKLMNDIASSPEYTAGTQGTNVPTTGNPSTAQAEAIVQDIYNNLFDRDATQADKDYWAPQLTGGSTTAPEMTINLITAAKSNANTTDADTLALKQEAATYYVTKVPQADFNRDTAKNAVDPVNSPITLNTSKEATDIIVSGVGVTKVLTTDTDTIAMTGGDDTVTGVLGTGATFAAADSVSDLSTTDNDTLTITGDSGGTFGTVKNVENVNVSLSARDLAGGFALTTTNVTGGDITLTVADEVTIAGVKFAGEQTATVTNLSSSDLTTNNVKDLTVTGASGTQTFALDNDAATVSISGVTANDTTLTLANNDVTVTIDGTAATNDAMSISGDNEVAVSNGASDVELLTLSGTNNDVVFTFTNVSDDSTKMVYTTEGSNDITLVGSSTQFNGASLVDNNSGKETLTLNAGGAASIEGFGVLSGGVNATAAADLKLTSGNTVNTSATAVYKFDANDAATDSAITINVGATTTSIETVKFESVTITSNDSAAIDLNALNFTDNSGAVVTISGANDISASTATGAHSLTITGQNVTLTDDITAMNEVTLTATNDVTTVDIGADNDITLTAGSTAGLDVDIGGNVTIASGNFKATGDDVKQTAGTTVVTKGNITISAANDVDFANAITASDGDILVTSVGEDVVLSGAVTATKGSVTINAANDANTNTITAQNDIDINVATGGGAGKDLADIDALSSTGTGNITIDADDITDISGAISANNGNVTITSANDITDAASSITASKGTITLSAGGDLTTDNGGGAKTLTGANVVLTAADDIVGKAAITAANDVTITTSGGAATNDITQSGLITTTNNGTVTLTGGAVSVKGGITAADSNVVITAAGVATVDTAVINVTKGAVSITGNDSTGTDLNIDKAVSASNDVTLTGAGKVDIEETITSSKNDVVITGDQIDTKALTATAGSVTLTAVDPAAANGSKIEGTVTAGANVTIADGTWDIDEAIAATGNFVVSGDAGLDLAANKDITAASVQLTTANDVTINGTTDSVLIVGSGGGNYNLGTVDHSGSNADVTINLGDGNDTLNINEGAADASTSKYIVETGGGVDTVTATLHAAGTVVNTEGGNDVVTIKLAGALATGTTSTFDLGADTADELRLDTGDYTTKKVSWANIEKLKVGDGTEDGTLTEAQFDGDNSYTLLNTAGTISVTGTTLDASNITVGGTAKFDLTGASTSDVLVGSNAADILDGQAAEDTLTGGDGADTFQVTEGHTGGGTTDAVKFDTITDWNTGGSDVIDHSTNLVMADAAGNTTAAAAGKAVFDATGSKATFDAADDTLLEKAIAVAGGIDVDTDGANAGNTEDGATAFFVHGGDTYVYISDQLAGYGTGDDLIKLTGVTGLTTITIAGNNATIG